VAERIGFSVRTVKRLLRAGTLPGVKPGPAGREWRVLESDLEAYVRESGTASVLAKRRNAAEAARRIAVARQEDDTPMPGIDPGVLPGTNT
jgi:excisionase family DNA binding protein